MAQSGLGVGGCSDCGRALVTAAAETAAQGANKGLRWRREQGRRKQERQWLKALAMACAGSEVAQVAGEGKDMK